MRTNEELAKHLKSIIAGEPSKSNEMSVTLLDPAKRCYGMRLESRLFLASLVDLPCIIEAQKTLDYNTFYKSCDAAQMLYVHNVYLENIGVRSEQEIRSFVAKFNPLTDDDVFFSNLFQRKKLKERLTRS